MARTPPPDAVLRAAPELQILALLDGRLLLRHRSGASLLGGVAAEDLARVLAAVDGRRTVDEVSRELAAEYDPAEVRRVLALLAGDALVPAAAPRGGGWEVGEPPAMAGAAPAPEAAPPVLVVGNGALGEALARCLGGMGGREVRRLRVAGFEVCAEPAFRARDGEVWVGGGSGEPAPRLFPAAETLERATAASLAQRLRGSELVVCALEGVPYRALFEVQAAALGAGVPALFATLEPDGATTGPLAVPGAGPCYACAAAARFRFLGLPVPSLPGALGHLRAAALTGGAVPAALTEAVGREVLETLAPGGEPHLLAAVLVLPAGREPLRLPVERLPGCPICGAPRPPETPSPRSAALAARAEAEGAAALDRRPHLTAEEVPSGGTVGIVGGGTAGYLAALALRRTHPALAVTLIESDEVPVIGVGEATTPLLPQFLHADLGLDAGELFRQVRPTLKLGIRFLWGPPARGGFHYPFGEIHPLEPAVYDGDLIACSLRSMLMAAGAVAVSPAAGGGWKSHLDVETAYHLENRRFVRYLKSQALAAGVERVVATLVGVEVSPDGGEVAALVAGDGRRFRFDLYLDCTGFRSMLLGEALGSPFLDYEASLKTDRALVAAVPHGGRLKPYTVAETLAAGWCWSTPQMEADHRGYVFSSAFLDPEAAEAEMRRTNPGMGEARLVRFRPGRRRHFWKGNVVALGNAYGFVEPLESTALHMLVRQIALLTEALPLPGPGEGLRGLLNRRVGEQWDYLAWFLALHYRFNRWLDTPFWRACREEVDVSRHGELLELYRERGPLTYDPAARAVFDAPDPLLWGTEGIDVMLLGQGVPGRLPPPAMGRQEWEGSRRRLAAVAARALPQEQALEVLGSRPELLEAFAAAFRRRGPVCHPTRSGMLKS